MGMEVAGMSISSDEMDGNSGGFSPTHLQNDGVRQLGLWHSQLNGKVKKWSKPPTSNSRAARKTTTQWPSLTNSVQVHDATLTSAENKSRGEWVISIEFTWSCQLSPATNPNSQCWPFNSWPEKRLNHLESKWSYGVHWASPYFLVSIVMAVPQ